MLDTLMPYLRGALDLVAPTRCPGCDAIRDVGCAGFCEVCAPLVDVAEHGPAGFVYGGPMAEAIRRLKYQKRIDVVVPLGSMLAAAPVTLRHLGLVDAVVPVPLHSARRRQRGFDQAALIAEPVAKALGVPLVRRRLRRTRATPEQAGLGRDGRLANVRGAFAVTHAMKARRVLLVDDVWTTGATMEAAGDALYAAGATDVRRLCLAAAI